jgi:tripartite-type tricarboxylate transporter receptor subunit TctC
VEKQLQFARRKFLKLATLATVAPAFASIAGAQAFPSRPITMIVPFVAGNGNDIAGRLIAEQIRASLGQPVIVENVSGASGSIGVGRVARSPPDGYTIGLGAWGTHVLNAALYALTYDTVKDFEPISLIGDTPMLIVAKKSMPANDLEGLIAWLKANPDHAIEGNAGQGSAGQLTAVLFQQMTNTRLSQVPYRGGPQALQDLMGGRIDLMMDPVGILLPQVRIGTIKAYAVTARARIAAAPEIPTVDEAGLPGLYVSGWLGIFAPKGTPNDVIDRINAAVATALVDPLVRGRLHDLGFEIRPRDQQTPEALRAVQIADIEKWWPIMKAAGIEGQK